MVRFLLFLTAAAGTAVAVYHREAVQQTVVQALVPADQRCTPCAARPPATAAPTPTPIRRVTVALGRGDLLRGIPGEGPLTLEQTEAWLAKSENHWRIKPKLPIGLDAAAADVRGLEDAPLTRAKIELGRQLFFDPRLSADGAISCASCHAPDHGFAGPERFGIGIAGQRGTRNPPTAANRILSDRQFHDGRAASLEEQALGPIANPAEMGSTHAACVATLAAIPAYATQFAALFDDGLTIDNVGRAIAAFERAIVSNPTAWDHHRRLRDFESAYAADLADPEELAEEDPELLAEHAALREAAAAKPLSASAARGAELFFGDRAGCAQCHVGANLTDERYHNLGVGLQGANAADASVDWGRYAVTGDEADRGAFKTPTLRNVAQTAPYMHDGSIDTLAEVVGWYVEGGGENRWLSERITPLDLDADEQADLVAFLASLSGEWPDVERGRLPE